MGFRGLGLRTENYPEILRGEASVDWFEIITENYIHTEGRPLRVLEKLRADFEFRMHGVSLNIGSPDPVDRHYLKGVKKLAEILQPQWVTDHFSWGALEGRHWHDLFPVPMNEEMVKHISQRIKQVQEILERPIALENISAYLRFRADELKEWEFIRAILEESGCFLLLDINNVYVNSFNHSEDPVEFIQSVPKDRVIQYHLAGHSDLDDFLFDTHDAPMVPNVLKLFQTALACIGPRPYMIEWDDKIPSLRELETELLRASAVFDRFQKVEKSENLWVGDQRETGSS